MSISIEQIAMVSSNVYVFLGFVVRDWSRAAEFTHYGGGGTGALTIIGHLISFLNALKVGWEVSTCISMIPVKSFFYQTTHSKVMLQNPNAPYMSIIG